MTITCQIPAKCGQTGLTRSTSPILSNPVKPSQTQSNQIQPGPPSQSALSLTPRFSGVAKLLGPKTTVSTVSPTGSILELACPPFLA